MDLLPGDSPQILRKSKQCFRSLKLLNVNDDDILSETPYGVDYGRFSNGLTYYVRINSKPRMRQLWHSLLRLGCLEPISAYNSLLYCTGASTSMVASAAVSTFLSMVSPASHPSGKTSGKISGSIPSVVGARGASNKSKHTGRLQIRASALTHPEVNGTKVECLDDKKVDEELIVPPLANALTIQLQDWNILLAAITTIFSEAEKQRAMLVLEPKQQDLLVDSFGLGRIVQDSLVFRQNFRIRSYEIGADRAASIETLMNHLQETALNHARSVGLLADGFGSTPEMNKKNLLWVVSKIHVVVDRYPKWADVVQIDSWIAAAGKNGMRRDWILQDENTGETLIRATSTWVMMNRETRKLSKMPDEVREEISGLFVDYPPIVEDDNRRLSKLDESTADYLSTGLTPTWNDLDLNQHVNNVKYVCWILESTPLSILDTHELTALTLEYRRECTRDSVLQSLTSVVYSPNSEIECQHLLRLEGGGDIVKGRTQWRPKFADKAPNGRSWDIPAS